MAAHDPRRSARHFAPNDAPQHPHQPLGGHGVGPGQPVHPQISPHRTGPVKLLPIGDLGLNRPVLRGPR